MDRAASSNKCVKLGLTQQRSRYSFRPERVALLTLPVSRFAQGQAGPSARRRSWRRRPIGLPLWRIARTRLCSTWHPHSAPTRPDIRLPARQVPTCSKLHTWIALLEPMPKKFGRAKIQVETILSERTLPVSTLPYRNLLVFKAFFLNDAVFFQYRCAPAESDSRS